MKRISAEHTAWLGAVLGVGLVFALTRGATSGIVAATSDPTAPRFHQTAVLLTDNHVLIAGGMRANEAVEASAELYDPVAGRFSPVASMHAPRVSAASALLAGSNVLIAGGWDGSSRCLAAAEIYDVAQRIFRQTGAMRTPRCGALAFALRNGKVLIAGGSLTTDSTQQASAELYDPKTGTFSPTGAMHVARSSFAGVVLNDGKVLVMGGWSAGTYPGRTVEASAEIYDPATGRFARTGSMTTPRYKMGAVRLASGRVFVVGGSDNRDWQGMLNSTEVYDPASEKFTRGANMTFRRFKLPDGVVSLGDGRVLVTGGAERAEVYDPATNAFTPAGGAALDGFYFSTATKLANNQVLIVGGYGEDPGAGAVRHAWLYRP
jgi:hypothetical protein